MQLQVNCKHLHRSQVNLPLLVHRHVYALCDLLLGLEDHQVAGLRVMAAVSSKVCGGGRPPESSRGGLPLLLMASAAGIRCTPSNLVGVAGDVTGGGKDASRLA